MTLQPVKEALVDAIAAAEALELDTADARAVARTIEEREGYPGDLYVLGFVGGTGVGKSSLLNALAGEQVSLASARRPTTRSAVALLPAGYEDDASSLLEWLGGAEVRTRADGGPAVAVVDLPDLDSIEAAHAARVDATLPKIDAVLWVTDPEKYDDAALHDRYLRRWMPRLARQAVVINKADRLPDVDMERIVADLRARLEREGLPAVPVLAVSAHEGVEPLRRWLLEGATGKAVVLGRLRQTAAATVGDLAEAADVDGATAPAPLLDAETSAQAASSAAAAILDVIGPGGLRDQATASALSQARAVGGGPVRQVQRLLQRGSGVDARRADPEAYLLRWRDRGSLDRAIAPIRQTLLAAAGTMPPRLRPGVLASADPSALEAQLAQGIDSTVGSPQLARGVSPSRLWPAIGLLQLAATFVLAVGLVWSLLLVLPLASIPVGTIDVPILGPMPSPLVLLIVGLLTAFLLDRFLRWQAGRAGRQWADAVLEDVSGRVEAVVSDVLGAQLSSMDEARHALWTAARQAESAALEAS